MAQVQKAVSDAVRVHGIVWRRFLLNTLDKLGMSTWEPAAAESGDQRGGVCKSFLSPQSAWHRPSGRPLLSQGRELRPSCTSEQQCMASKGYMSTDRKSSFGLKLQIPSNPFASRKPRPTVQKLVLYRGRGMLLFRFIVRAKVFQLMGFLACAVFTSVVLTTSNPDPMDLAAVGALAVGCVVTSYCIWYYSGRYVGEMSLLLPERRVVRLSVLDFWGNREDNDVPLEKVVAPWRNRSVAEVRAQARQALMPVEVDGDRQYYISVPHGYVLQKEILQKLMYGAPIDEEGKRGKDVEVTSVQSPTVVAAAPAGETALKGCRASEEAPMGSETVAHPAFSKAAADSRTCEVPSGGSVEVTKGAN